MYREFTAEQVRTIEDAGVPVDSTHPQWCWLVSINRESEMPTDLEIRQLRSIAEYRLSKFFDHYQVALRAKAYNSAREKGKGNLLVDGGCVTHVFQKGSPYTDRETLMVGWHYRRSTWDSGFAPARHMGGKDKDLPPLTLEQAVDRMYSITDEDGEPRVYRDWLEWKAAHPDIFPAIT